MPRSVSLPSCAAPLVVLVLLCSGCTSSDRPGAQGAQAAGGASTETTDDGSGTDTVDEILELGRPIVLAHAGGNNAAPNATVFAYAEAYAAGADMLDVDVRLSGDGVLVAHHDEEVDRTTGSTGLVADMSYEELHALDNAYWFTEECDACTSQPRDAYPYRGVRTGEVPPPSGYQPDDFAVTSFESLLERFPEAVFNVEIKGSVEESVPAAEELARVLADGDRLDAAVVTAKDDDLVAAFQDLAPEVVVTPGLGLTTEYVDGDETLPRGSILQVPPEYEGREILTPALVETAHADGHVLWIWPNDRDLENAQGYRELLDLGVDGINASDPAVAVEVVEER